MLVCHLGILGCVTVIAVIVNESVDTLYLLCLANASLPQRVRATLDRLIEFGFRNCKADPQSKFAEVTNSTSLRFLGNKKSFWKSEQ